MSNNSSPVPPERKFSRQASFKSFSFGNKDDKTFKVPEDAKTKDIYGFEVDAKRSHIYRGFYEKFLTHSQRQTVKAQEMVDSGVFKNWSCIYAKGRAQPPENARFDEVAALVRDGLPMKNRGEIWLHLTGVISKVKLFEGSESVYESLLRSYDHPDSNGSNSTPSTVQIEKDLPRTFPGYNYTPKGKKFQPALRRVLRAYAMRNPKLGYCQSMNFIAGGLLLFLEEAEAFWMLCFVVEEMLPDYFSKNIIGPQIDAEVLTLLMEEQLPVLRDHFDATGVSTLLISTQWFMCLFMRTLPHECAFRIWDSLFLYGPQVLFEVGLAILKMHQRDLLVFEDTIDIITHLGNSLSEMFDCSNIWDVQITRIDHKRIGASREVQKERVLRDMRMRTDILDLMDAIPSSKFSRDQLEDLYIQYANLSPKLNDRDVVEKGLTKEIFQQVITNICNWEREGNMYFLDRLFSVFDVNHSNRVDFKELITGLAILCKGNNDEKLRMCFQLFDKNADGYVDRKELHTMLSSLYTIYNSRPKRNSQGETSEPKGSSRPMTPENASTTSRPQTPEPAQRPMTPTHAPIGLKTIWLAPPTPTINKLTQSVQSFQSVQSVQSVQSEHPLAKPNPLSLSVDFSKLPSISSAFQPPELTIPKPRSSSGGSSQTPSPEPPAPKHKSPKLPKPSSKSSKSSSKSKKHSPPGSPEVARLQASQLSQSGGIAQGPASPPDPAVIKPQATKLSQSENGGIARTPGTHPDLKVQIPGSPPASEPEKEKSIMALPPTSPDYANEVAFFVDVFFKNAAKDGLLSPEEFREAALLHPYILQVFNLDHQHNYDIRISV